MIPRNPFTALVKIRSVRERQARGELGRSRLIQQEALDRLEAMKARLAQLPGLPPSLSPVQLRALQLTGVVEEERLIAAANAHEDASHAAEERAARWRHSAEELDASERLEAKKREEAVRRATKATERALDDLMLAIRARNRS